jgi:hypothetical protein
VRSIFWVLVRPWVVPGRIGSPPVAPVSTRPLRWAARFDRRDEHVGRDAADQAAVSTVLGDALDRQAAVEQPAGVDDRQADHPPGGVEAQDVPLGRCSDRLEAEELTTELG